MAKTIKFKNINIDALCKICKTLNCDFKILWTTFQNDK